MAYFSLLYESESRERLIKANAKAQLFRSIGTNQEREFEMIGNKMVPVINNNTIEKKYLSYFIDLDLDQVVKTLLNEEDHHLNNIFMKYFRNEPISYTYKIMN